MLTDSMTLERMTADDIATARECLLRLLANDIAIGSWSDKTEVRQTGCSIHVKYAKKATVSLAMSGGGTSNEFVVLMLKSPDVLWALLVKLFDISDEDLEALKAGATDA
jgi:hypothetical protein